MHASALHGLAARQAMILRYWTSNPQRDLIVQSPAHRDGPTGVFALRLPARPNPVASAVVRLLGNDVQAGILRVDALDAFDGTALLDVKPWLPGVHVPPELGH
jgi:tRNA (Thr-GGU) A37 N-methylase